MSDEHEAGMGVAMMLEYECPVHGNVQNQTISSSVPGHEGVWCMVCWLETFDKLGIQRVTEVKTDE